MSEPSTPTDRAALLEEVKRWIDDPRSASIGYRLVSFLAADLSEVEQELADLKAKYRTTIIEWNNSQFDLLRRIEVADAALDAIALRVTDDDYENPSSALESIGDQVESTGRVIVQREY